MDAHFDNILSKSKNQPKFIAVKHNSNTIARSLNYNDPNIKFGGKFEGCKKGYVFQMGDQGLGYYYDTHYSFAPKSSSSGGGSSSSSSSGSSSSSSSSSGEVDHSGKKRTRDEFAEEGGDGEEEDEEDEASRSKKNVTKGIDQLLEEAEEADIKQLDPTTLKQLLLSVEKKITKNQKMRMKYPAEPEKFMESELELHTEIQELYAVAASPELYSILVQTGAVSSILGMITHENTDISIATVGLLQEMTDTDTILEEREEVDGFVQAFVAQQGFELIVQNLSRLDESSDEDAQGVYNTMAIIENLTEFNPEWCAYVCDKTHILKYLLLRLKVKKFDGNKLYCSEILSILLQADESNQVRLCSLAGADGMDLLLQAIALYRKKEVILKDEQECVENLFLCLCNVLVPRENQFKFLACEGFELVLRCLKEKQYAAGCVINVVKYAVMKNKDCCERFIDTGGLKYLFQLLAGVGVKKTMKKNTENATISILANLCAQLYKSSNQDYTVRLLGKFVECEGEKIERCAEMYAKNMRMLTITDEKIEKARERMVEDGADEEELQEFDTDEDLNTERMEGGLFNVQQLSIVLCFACIHSKACRQKVEVKLSLDDLGLDMVLDSLRGVVLSVDEKEGGDDPFSSSSNSIGNGSSSDGSDGSGGSGGSGSSGSSGGSGGSGGSGSSSGSDGSKGTEASKGKVGGGGARSEFVVTLTEWAALLDATLQGRQ